MITPKQPNWSLKELFESLDDPKIKEVFSFTENLAKEFEQSYKTKVASLSADELAKAYKSLEKCYSAFYKLSQFVRLSYAVNTQGEAEKILLSRVESFGSQLGNQLLFFQLEMAKVSDELAKEWLESEQCKPYCYTIEQTLKKARYKLSEKEEQLINMKDLTGSNAFQKLYGELTASFEFELEIDGEQKTLNGSELRALRLHKDPALREKAMKMFFERYEAHQISFTHFFNTVLKDYVTESSLRGYTHPMQAMNTGNDLPDDVIDLLHEVTNESYGLVQRYYQIKKKVLKLDTLSLADIYAPLPFKEKKITWDEAKEMVLAAFKAFDPEFEAIAHSMFDQNRVDVPVQKAKRGGAFCSSSTPDIYPYVLLNFLGKSRDVSTLAHEFGHAIHAVLSNKNHLFNYHAILPLCETASVFCEMCLVDYRRKTETNPLDRAILLMDSLEDIFATSHRQNMFSNFEKSLHNAVSKSWVSADTICALYKEELSRMFGDVVEIPEHFKWEWSAIPHMIDVPFYVHSYNFGNLLVIALYQQYLKEGKNTFYPKLKKMLESGSSASPIQLTQAMGIDLTQKSFWTGSLVYIESLIDELALLVSENDLHALS